MAIQFPKSPGPVSAPVGTNTSQTSQSATQQPTGRGAGFGTADSFESTAAPSGAGDVNAPTAPTGGDTTDPVQWCKNWITSVKDVPLANGKTFPVEKAVGPTQLKSLQEKAFAKIDALFANGNQPSAADVQKVLRNYVANLGAQHSLNNMFLQSMMQIQDMLNQQLNDSMKS